MVERIWQRQGAAVRRSLRTCVDLALLSLAYWAAFLLRFDGDLPLQMWKRLVFTWPYVVALEFAVLKAFAVTRFAWSYVGLREATRTLWAVMTSAALLLAVRVASAMLSADFGHAQYALVPGGVIAGNAGISFLLILGARALRRLSVEHTAEAHRTRVNKVPTILLGAGKAGVMVAKEIAAHPDLPIRAVAFLDDDLNKKGSIVHGVRVFGETRLLPEVARRTGARQAIISMTHANGQVVRQLLELCERAGVQAKIIPGIYQILDGRVNLSRIRDVSIEDLLGREQVQLDEALVSRFIAGKRVVVTGAGGSIGSELCRQLTGYNPSALILIEQAEPALFAIHHELTGACPNLMIVPCIGDVLDADRIRALFTEHAPAVVFHAAAHKHVPMMEWNPGEAIKNNVFGTKVIADAAHEHGCESFVMISTDKAVNPTSIMGATKRVAEMYIQALSQESSTNFVAVRFGNVLGSAGSVVPIFKAQIARGGPVTITHPEMLRYFMTIPEACQLVMQAGALGDTGQIFVLDMGEPVRIADLARELIRLSGFEPDVDIRIQVTGLRPGEKLFEELVFDTEHMARTRHPKIYIGKLAPVSRRSLAPHLDRLRACATATDPEEIRRALSHVVPEMRPSAAPPAPAGEIASALPVRPALA